MTDNTHSNEVYQLFQKNSFIRENMKTKTYFTRKNLVYLVHVELVDHGGSVVSIVYRCGCRPLSAVAVANVLLLLLLTQPGLCLIGRR